MPHAASQALINARYAVVHAAAPSADYPDYLTVGDAEAPLATLGLRFADGGRLFLERYIAEPIETLIADRMHREVGRERIVELGHHASIGAVATTALWQRAVLELSSRADVAVAVLTAPLRGMLLRAGLSFTALAAADPAALGDEAETWGRYYASDPIVCAGWIADGAAIVTRFRAGRAS